MTMKTIIPHAGEQPIIGASIAVFVAIVLMFRWSRRPSVSSGYQVTQDAPHASDVHNDEVWKRITCWACAVGLLATVASASCLRLNSTQPIQQPVVEKLARCGCEQILGATILIPTYQMFFSQFWLVFQAAVMATAKSILQHGFRGARIDVDIRGGLSMVVAASVVDCSHWIWVPMLAMHAAHFIFIASRLAAEGRNLVTVYHETYFTYFASGAVSFLVFATIGARLCNELVFSVVRETVYKTTLKQASEIMATYDSDKDGFLKREEFAQVPGEAFYASESWWPKTCAGFGLNEKKGLDLESLRRCLVLHKKFFDRTAPCVSDQGKLANGEVQDTLVVGGDANDCWEKTLLVRSGTQNGLPMWVCKPILGEEQALKSDGVSWVFECGYHGMACKSSPHDGRLPELVTWGNRYKIAIEVARVKHLQAAPFYPLARLKVKTEQTQQARALRSKLVSLLVIIMSPTAATHLFPGMVRYFYIIIPLFLVSLLLACAAAGVGEQWGDVEHGNLHGSVAHEVGKCEGYKLEGIPVWFLPYYTHIATSLRHRQVLVRLVLIYVALTGLVLCVQLSFNYAMMRYLGYDVYSVPAKEWMSRTIRCETCQKIVDTSQKLHVISWFA